MEEDSPQPGQYKEGDIVWVKLGSCWWPGEVVNKVPDDDYTPSKKPPLAIVKFFNENAYEFVKTANLIFPYKCAKKNDFIKKGMDSFRANNAHMEKFPTDVSLAELKTDGNPNILSDPQFLPQKKVNIVAEVFGSPSPKKTPKDGAVKGRGRPSSKGSSSSKKSMKVNVTHRRFLGCDDYESRIRMQYPGKDSLMCASSDDEVIKLNAEPENDIVCSACKFKTNRIEVMFFHVNCHIKGIPCAPVGKSRPKKKAVGRKPQKRAASLPEDEEKTNDTTDSDEEAASKPKQKRKRRTQGNPSIQRKPKIKKIEHEEQKSFTDIRTDLLAEWSDSDDGDEGEPDTTPKQKVTTESINSSVLFDKLTSAEKEVEADETFSEASKSETKSEASKSETKSEASKSETKSEASKSETKSEVKSKKDKSCFDFEEEDEDSSIVHTAAVGRKIPRVIPPSEKRKSNDPDDEDACLPLAEEDENRVGLLKESGSSSSEDKLGKDDFKELMEATSVPELPEVPEVPAQNFPSGKAIKFPDKPEVVTATKEVATKLTNPKKRFVKSFEDFEIEQRKAEEKKKEAAEAKAIDKDIKVAETSSGKDTKLTGKPSDKDAKVTEKPNDEITNVVGKPVDKDSKVAEKLIDEDTKVTEKPSGKDTRTSRKSSEKDNRATDKSTDKDTKAIEKPSDKYTKVTEKTTKFTEKEVKTSSNDVKSPEKQVEMKIDAIPETTISDKDTKPTIEEVKKNDANDNKSGINLRISKLKTQIMSKLGDEPEPESPKYTPVRASTRISHRSPRSKILENYRNSSGKGPRKSTEEKIEVLEVTQKGPRKSTEEKTEVAETKSTEEKTEVAELARKEPIESTEDKTEVAESAPKEPEKSTEEKTELAGLARKGPRKSTEEKTEVGELARKVPKKYTEEKTEVGELARKAPRKSTEEQIEVAELARKTPRKSTEEKTEVAELPRKGPRKSTEEKTEVAELARKTPKKSTEEKTEVAELARKTPRKSTEEKTEVAELPRKGPRKSTEEKTEVSESTRKGPRKFTEEKGEVFESTRKRPRKSTEEKTEVPEVNHMNTRKSKYLKFQAEQEVDSRRETIESETEPENLKVESKLEVVEAIQPTETKLKESQPKVTKQKDSKQKEVQSKELKQKEIKSSETKPSRETKQKRHSEETRSSVQVKKFKETLGEKMEVQAIVTQEKVVADAVMTDSKPVEEPHSVDDYLNDFFTFTKRVEPSVKPDEIFLNKESPVQQTMKDEEEMSALTTLAAVSELKTSLGNKPFEDDSFKVPPIMPASEMVPIDGNLTVVSEKDLADGQVEITADTSPTIKKPVTLTNFSLDFQDTDSNEIRTKTPDLCDMEDLIPSQIVCASEPSKDKESQKMLPHTSKLLERLTEPRPNANQKTHKSFSKTIPSRSIRILSDQTVVPPKSSISTVPVPVPSASSSKPIILSEKIIKPDKAVTDETSGSVSVQKITSNRVMLDADEIDTFIIQRDPTHVSEEKEEPEDDYMINAKKKMTPAVASDVKKPTPVAKPTSIVKPTAIAKPTSVVKPTSIVKKARGGKAKILQQTIITPAGEIIQPQPVVTAPAAQPEDNSVFDINSMPIVLSDQILTPESIENMPIFLSDAAAAEAATPTVTPAATAPTPKTTPQIKKQIIQQTTPMRVLNKTMMPTTLITSSTNSDKTPKLAMKTTTKQIISSSGKVIKQNSFTPMSGTKHGKYVIVTQGSPATPHTSKYTVGKKQTIVKRTTTPSEATSLSSGTLTKIAPEPSGNKIMILTNQQGQQQRVLLTPAQQKLMGYQNQGNKIGKTLVKGNVLQRGKEVQIRSGQVTSVAGPSGILAKNAAGQMPGSQRLITSTGQVLSQLHAGKTVRIEKTLGSSRKLQMQSQKVPISKPTQKTILIKNQHGQTVTKIQGTDEALLDKQVAEQIEAIKAQQHKKQTPDILNYRSSATSAAATPSRSFRRSYSKKVDAGTKVVARSVKESASSTNQQIPPLAPISPKRVEAAAASTSVVASTAAGVEEKPTDETKRAQLVIQDAMGNQTTITEGQILALPSETVDGQPQSYMLVTLDETGNLTPLNNEALMSLDPNLGLTGDLGNMVLQIDQGKETGVAAAAGPAAASPSIPTPTPITTQSTVVQNASTPQTVSTTQPVVAAASTAKTTPHPAVQPAAPAPPEVPVPTTTVEEKQPEHQLPTVNCSVSGEPGGQQLIVTGDPIAAQKFLESLTENSTDLANILAASAEGGSILIQTDGQQILINTETDNQMLLSVNTDSLTESTENGGNPIFATQPSKNQDILAAALADTDVFQPSETNSQKSQLSPNSALYPMNVGNVLETSLTLNSPIMTPLEVPSTNSKKLDESDILSQVPKNVDLPITITDPNIAQTVSQQQMIAASELQELALPISEASAESPSFVYSLPSLDGTVDINQKPFNSSMPLLTEDETEVNKEVAITSEENTTEVDGTELVKEALAEEIVTETEEPKLAPTPFLDDTEGLCTLGGEMCSSLSEPPPDMFDLSVVLSEEKTRENSEKTELKIDVTEEADKEQAASTDLSNPDTTSVTSVTETSSPNGSISLNEDSCEIPVQPELVTAMAEEVVNENDGKRPHPENEEEKGETSKRCKFDD